MQALHFLLPVVFIIFTAITFSHAQGTSEDAGEFITESIIKPARKTYYVEPGSQGTIRETDPPGYVRDLRQAGFIGDNKKNWLNMGLDYRTRFEMRRNDIRRTPSINNEFPFLIRTRAYLGVKELIDPLRFAIEVEDARKVNGKYPLNDRDVNAFEPIQCYGELHFKKALGEDRLGNARPMFIRGGRMAFEFLDRRLIGLNLWRNTTNNFTGLYVSMGNDHNDWEVNMLALRPVNRFIDKFDQRDKDRIFYALIAHWRRWSEFITIEPNYIGLRQEASAENNFRFRHIHHTGIRIYGWIADSRINYDLTGSFQFGKESDLKHRAYAYTLDVGYTIISLKSQPRLGLFFGYVSGDRSPDDNYSYRFERFFGFSRPWSGEDFIVMENIIAPKARFSFEPIKGVLFDGGYSFFWLASATDRYVVLMEGGSFSRDDTGGSGRFVGHGSEVRSRFKPAPFIYATVGYIHFTTGEFVRNRQEAANGNIARSSDFGYIELIVNFFDLVGFANKKAKN